MVSVKLYTPVTDMQLADLMACSVRKQVVVLPI